MKHSKHTAAKNYHSEYPYSSVIRSSTPAQHLMNNKGNTWRQDLCSSI